MLMFAEQFVQAPQISCAEFLVRSEIGSVREIGSPKLDVFVEGTACRRKLLLRRRGCRRQEANPFKAD